MLIGELVEKSGMSKDTIRFYEKKGLIALDGKSRRIIIIKSILKEF